MEAADLQESLKQYLEGAINSQVSFVNPVRGEKKMDQMSFVKACSAFFGRKPGQSLVEFSNELKALTEKDRQDLKDEFAKIGVEDLVVAIEARRRLLGLIVEKL